MQLKDNCCQIFATFSEIWISHKFPPLCNAATTTITDEELFLMVQIENLVFDFQKKGPHLPLFINKRYFPLVFQFENNFNFVVGGVRLGRICKLAHILGCFLSYVPVLLPVWNGVAMGDSAHLTKGHTLATDVSRTIKRWGRRACWWGNPLFNRMADTRNLMIIRKFPRIKYGFIVGLVTIYNYRKKF